MQSDDTFNKDCASLWPLFHWKGTTNFLSPSKKIVFKCSQMRRKTSNHLNHILIFKKIYRWKNTNTNFLGVSGSFLIITQVQLIAFHIPSCLNKWNIENHFSTNSQDQLELLQSLKTAIVSDLLANLLFSLPPYSFHNSRQEAYEIHV